MRTMKQRIDSHIPSLLILFVPVVFFHWKILFLGEILCGGDLINQFVPWREFALDEWRQGRFPAWNPFVFCGTPFAANIQTSLFYPWNVLNLFFSVEHTFSLSLVFHHLLSLGAMYLFLNALWKDKAGAVFGALVYGWSGFFLTHGHDGHLIHVRAYALVPLALYLQTRWREEIRFSLIFLFALCLAGLFYAGHTQLPLYVFYLLLCRACWWGIWEFRRKRRFALLAHYPLWTLMGLFLAVLLGAKVLLPLYELSTLTAGRAGGADYLFATNDSLPPQHLITLAAPFFYGDPTSPAREGQFWETRTGYHEICGYSGILPLILLFFLFIPAREKEKSEDDFHRREAIFFLLIAIGALFFSLGRFNPLYPIFYYGLPGWAYFRVPGRLVFLFILGIAVCSARGLALWKPTPLKEIVNEWYFKSAAIASLLFGVSTLILALSKAGVLSWLREFEIDRTITEYHLYYTSREAIGLRLPELLFETRFSWMLGSCLAACAVGLLGWLALLAANRLKTPVAQWLPAGALLLDLLLFGHRFVETKPAEEWRDTFFPQTELVTFLQEHAQGYRVLCLDDAIGFPALDKHPELRPNRLMHYRIESARGYDPIILKSYTRFVNRLYGKDPDKPQGGLLFFPTPPPVPDLSMMNVKFLVTTQELSEPFKLVWKEESEPSLRIYENPTVKPRVYLENESPENELTVRSSKPGEVEIEVSTSQENRLIYSQSVHPRWTAGQEGNLEFLPESLQDEFPISATVQPGDSTISIRFSSIRPDFFVSEFTFAICCGIVIFARRRKKTHL